MVMEHAYAGCCVCVCVCVERGGGGGGGRWDVSPSAQSMDSPKFTIFVTHWKHYF